MHMKNYTPYRKLSLFVSKMDYIAVLSVNLIILTNTEGLAN